MKGWLAPALLVPTLLAFLAACAPRPQAHPALWEVRGADGQHGYLFGTMHELPARLDWRTAAIDRALGLSDRLVVEAAGIADTGASARIFAQLASAPGLGPLSARLAPAQRPALARLLARLHQDEGRYARIKTWAAALMLAQAEQGGGAASPDNGADRALLADTLAMPVAELEGVAPQLQQFDRLAPAQQVALLNAVSDGDASADADLARLIAAWSNGDMAQIEAETHRGLLADPALRAALFVNRNAAWSDSIAALLAQHQHPFVAVGAAHMAGPDGLVASLTARGYTITRIA